MNNTETKGTLGWKTQEAENEALLHKGVRGKPVFLPQTGEQKKPLPPE